jgi:nicotinamidase-related amidase
MLDGPLIFVDVDTQRDFLEPDGALFISGSEVIRPNLARLTRFAREQGIPILATACAHHEGDPLARRPGLRS